MFARREYLDSAQAAFDAQTDPEVIEGLRARGEETLEDFCERLADLKSELAQEVPDDIDLPKPVVPLAVEQEAGEVEPMFTTKDDWSTATQKLKAVKNYRD